MAKSELNESMIQCISNLLNGSIQDWWLMKGYKPRVRYANVFYIILI